MVCRDHWNGWNFDAVYDAGLQLDEHANITEIYEIEHKATQQQPIFEILSEALREAEQ